MEKAEKEMLLEEARNLLDKCIAINSEACKVQRRYVALNVIISLTTIIVSALRVAGITQ